MGQEGSRALPIPLRPKIVEDLLNPREWPWLYLAKKDYSKALVVLASLEGVVAPFLSPDVGSTTYGDKLVPQIHSCYHYVSTCPPESVSAGLNLHFGYCISICYCCWLGIYPCSSFPQLFQSPLQA